MGALHRQDCRHREETASLFTAQGSTLSQVKATGPWGLAGMQAGLRLSPLYPLCPVQPCPTGKTNRGSLLLATSQCPQHVPSMSPVPRVPDSYTFPVWEGADEEHLTTSHWH